MELLLNLGWLLLAMPALWLWREAARTTGRRKFSALQGIFCLGCALVVLFPVVSATDDLRAMRAEMEESPTSKRSIVHCSHEKGSSPNSHVQTAVAVAGFAPAAFERGWLSVVFPPVIFPESRTSVRPGRAPPQLKIS